MKFSLRLFQRLTLCSLLQRPSLVNPLDDSVINLAVHQPLCLSFVGTGSKSKASKTCLVNTYLDSDLGIAMGSLYPVSCRRSLLKPALHSADSFRSWLTICCSGSLSSSARHLKDLNATDGSSFV
ncbi:hypothetical protein BJX68DRAFT_195383 [Aspergillus pseudodeflectus]|uniref:Secreted protein n=1 Tax=Aspergillus pseudodeflectus TaxID=176178 RepID=A0ABR4L0H7_9EURO